MYSSTPSLVLAFHGCDRDVGEAVLDGNKNLKYSKNEYDWLGSGIYFWERDPLRAKEYAELLRDNPKRCREKINIPFVLGAVIDLGNCLNLLERESLKLVEESYKTLKESFNKAGLDLPLNHPVGSDKELLRRNLDCAVIEALHQSLKDDKANDDTVREFDTVRAVFPEGKPLYEGAGFRSHSHIQICVRNPNCIKGFFRLRDKHSKYPLP